jgi:hypothetical protein
MGHPNNRQRNQPFNSAVGPVGAGGVFIEEFERGDGTAGGSFAALKGLYGLPARFSQELPFGDSGPGAAPALDANQQMLWLALPAQLEGDDEQYRWNGAITALPTPPAGGYAYQIDASYIVGVFDGLLAADAATPKPGSIGIILGTADLLAPLWPGPFYFSNTVTDAGETETQPELWADGNTVDSTSVASSDSFSRTYVTLLMIFDGTNTRILTYTSTDGVSKALVGDQTFDDDTEITHIGFAVRSERPAVGDPGLPVSGWCDYIRVRTAQEGDLGTVAFGQTGGRNW